MPKKIPLTPEEIEILREMSQKHKGRPSIAEPSLDELLEELDNDDDDEDGGVLA